nr:hypothetical protein [Sphingobium cloacae]
MGNRQKQEIGRWANNRVENSHLASRRRERVLRFRQMKALQKFAAVHANIPNHFSHERHLIDREFRRFATRYERRTIHLAGFVHLAAAMIWMRSMSIRPRPPPPLARITQLPDTSSPQLPGAKHHE